MTLTVAVLMIPYPFSQALQAPPAYSHIDKSLNDLEKIFNTVKSERPENVKGREGGQLCWLCKII
jgi:hypothetical protein